jgi:hypothetical protein
MSTYSNWDAGKPSAAGDWRDLDRAARSGSYTAV